MTVILTKCCTLAKAHRTLQKVNKTRLKFPVYQAGTEENMLLKILLKHISPYTF